MRILIATLLSLVSIPGFAETMSLPGVSIDLDGLEREEATTAMQVLVLLTVLSLAPAILIMLSSFTRIVIVLAMLRHAFGMQQTPPNVVMVSLALFLTLFSMMPVLRQIDEVAYAPYVAGTLDVNQAVRAGSAPLKDFMLRQTREQDLLLVIELAGEERPESVDEVTFWSLAPAFMLSELQTAFQIGFVIFLPFLVVDLVVASVLMAMGMIMVPPLTISLPIKILMFVLIEGWALVAQALVKSFY